MINLIPPTARRSVIREYWLRVVSVWMFLLGTGFLIVAALLLPTYVQIWIQLENLSAATGVPSEKISNYDTAVSELVAATSLARILTTEASSTQFSTYISDIAKLAGDNIAITSYTFERKPTGDTTIMVAGIAATRQVLANFEDELSNNEAFSRVDLPISNLIKDRDVLFSLQLELATSTTEI
jgi:hypothetical protein